MPPYTFFTISATLLAIYATFFVKREVKIPWCLSAVACAIAAAIATFFVAIGDLDACHPNALQKVTLSAWILATLGAGASAGVRLAICATEPDHE